jgi:hypothetical protein
VNLHARPVDLVLERGLAESLHGLVDVLRRLGQHRLNRREGCQAKAREPCASLIKGNHGHRSRLAGQHDGAANVGDVDRCRFRDGIYQHAFERALAKLAQNQADQEVALGGGGAVEQPCQLLAARLLRALALRGGYALESGIDIEQRQRRRARRLTACQATENRRPQADAALWQPAGQVVDHQRDLASRGLPQAAAQQRALLEAAAGGGHRARGFHQFRELHRVVRRGIAAG